MPVPIPDDEAARLAALEAYDVLDTPPDDAFDRITRMASRVLGMPIALVSLVDEHRQWFKSRCGLNAEETSREDAFCAHTIMGNDVMVVSDAQTDPRFVGNPLVLGDPNIRFYAGAPLTTKRGFNLGTLCVIDRQPRDLGPDELATLKDLASMVVDELELRRLASIDELTGTLNRRHFLDLANREQRRARRYAYSLAVGVLDIDHFKGINDTYGHDTGDAVLKAFAALCGTELREMDIFARFGGEEFVVLMPHTREAGASRVGERIRARTEQMKVVTKVGDVRLTASIGIAAGVPEEEDFRAVLKRADDALYDAKYTGRNRVTIAAP